MEKNINFSNHFKSANIFSGVIFFISILFIIFKGLNYGIDFKGGTLLEIQVSDKNIKVTEIRNVLKKFKLRGCECKKFWK